jgi:hypothetical protein
MGGFLGRGREQTAADHTGFSDTLY